MIRNNSRSGDYAVSEVMGGIILLLIALVVFSVIMTYVFPIPIDLPDPNVDLMGYVDRDGLVVLEHMGGEALSQYQIDIKNIDETLIDSNVYKNLEDKWEIGECLNPCSDVHLYTEEDKIKISVYAFDNEGLQYSIFEGILSGGIILTDEDTEPSMLISSLRTNTADEDLICYNYTITPSIPASTYIYNWTVNGNSIMDLLMPFDTNSTDNAKDYSGGKNNGTVNGPIWNNNCVIGGGYYFDGLDDYISIPYIFDGNYIDEFTVETWIKTNASSSVITSFNPNVLWELFVSNGYVGLSTNASDGLSNTVGETAINDDNWHHIAASYDSTSGNCSIYVDGWLDKVETIHSPDIELGIGSTPSGSIGLGSESTGNTVFSTSFETQNEENQWANDPDRSTDWSEEGIFERFGSDTMTPKTGSYTIGGTGDLYYWWERHYAAYNRTTIDISEYTDVEVSVWYSYKSTESDDELGFYYKDGSNWITIFEETNPSIGDGVQSDWVHAVAQIPDSIDDLTLQFWWSTSSSREYVVIDNLTITGIPRSGGNNYSGYMDELHIYNRALSAEQVYQNYLCQKDGFTDLSVIVSDETNVGDTWRCDVTPNDGIQDDELFVSNSLNIVNYGGG